MSEERTTSATAEEKMRVALENAKLLIMGTTTDPENSLTIKQIDEALAMKSPEITPVRYHQAWGQGYQACLEDTSLEKKSALELRLLELPDAIKEMSLQIAKDTTEVEKLRTEIARLKNQHLEVVLCATENNKPKYSNDKARNVALESLLKGDGAYLAHCDELGLLESQLKREEIELAHSQNLFRAYLAIAGMQGVK